MGEAAGSGRRDVVVLALDGVPFGFAADLWKGAQLECLESVFPTSSSTAWLSSLTGASVDQHGIPGVVVRSSSGLVNVFQERGRLRYPALATVFADARARGYRPCAILGDWEPFDCGWRDALLAGAERLTGFPFFSGDADVEDIVPLLREAVDTARGMAGGPHFIWCFVDLDRHVHRHGYDGSAVAVLSAVDELARDLTAGGCRVIAHSDHGLVRTRHDVDLAEMMDEAARRFASPIGGAGRTRWFHAAPSRRGPLADHLRARVGDDIAVLDADVMFAPGSLARRRAGSLLLIAKGDRFTTFNDEIYEHGSLTPEERFVPFADWGCGG